MANNDSSKEARSKLKGVGELGSNWNPPLYIRI